MIFNWVKRCLIEQQFLNQGKSNGLTYRMWPKSAAVMWSFSTFHDSFPAGFVIPHFFPHPARSKETRELNGKGDNKTEVGSAPAAFLPTIHFLCLNEEISLKWWANVGCLVYYTTKVHSLHLTGIPNRITCQKKTLP